MYSKGVFYSLDFFLFWLKIATCTNVKDLPAPKQIALRRKQQIQQGEKSGRV